MRRYLAAILLTNIFSFFLASIDGFCQEKITQYGIHSIYVDLNSEIEQLHSKCFNILKQGIEQAKKNRDKVIAAPTEIEFLNTLPEFTEIWIKIRSYFYQNIPPSEASSFMQASTRSRASLLEASVVAQYIFLRFHIVDLKDVAITCLKTYQLQLEMEKIELQKFQNRQQSNSTEVFKLDPIVPKSNVKLPPPARGHMDLMRAFSALDERASKIFDRYANSKNSDSMAINEARNSQIGREFQQVLNEYIDERLKLGVTLDELKEPQIALSARIAAGLSQARSLYCYLSFRLKNPQWLSVAIDCDEVSIVLAKAMTNVYKSFQGKN